MSVSVITLDGPSGVGKSTVARSLCRQLNYNILVSGALYRTVALLILHKNIADDDVKSLLPLVSELDLRFVVAGETVQILQNGKDISRELLSEHCADYASRIAKLPELRAELLEYQRSFRVLPGLVADGRDMGTAVFPDAQTKVFLTASLEERAARRSKQLSDNDFNGRMARLIDQMAVRDRRDSERKYSPLKPAGDAIIIDTTDKTADQAAEEIIGLLPCA